MFQVRTRRGRLTHKGWPAPWYISWKFMPLVAALGWLGGCSNIKDLFSSGGGGAEDHTNSRINQDATCDELVAAASGTTSSGASLEDLSLAPSAFVEEAARALALSLPLGVLPIPEAESHQDRGPGDESVSFDFFVEDIKLCVYQARAHLLHSKASVAGKLPPKDLDIEPLSSLTWPDTAMTALQHIRSRLGLDINPGDHTVTHLQAQKCAYLDGTDWQAGFEIAFDEQGLPYYGIASPGGVWRAEPRYFDLADGIAQAYIKSPAESTTLTLSTIPLNNLSGGGALCNEKLRIQAPEGTTTAFNLNNEFVYSPGDYRFNQASVFANAHIHTAWLQTLPAAREAWLGPHITIALDASREGKNNTAVYLPAKTTPTATIKLGEGDDKALMQLHVDGDVISHELGHHIIYRTLKSTQGEALVIHEGLADYLVFARTQNACLGELICPVNSSICLSTQCLRSGVNSLTFTDPDLPIEGHKRSQLISGWLWDLGKSIGHAQVANLIYRGVDYLPKDGGYYDLIVSLMTADKAEHQGIHVCTIKNTADARGFSAMLGAIECDTF